MTTETDESNAVDNRPSAGERLRAAREKKKLTLEEVASQTRIPRRHLESLELSDWSRLPAPTYTIGFAKSYASAVGLDRSDIGDQLRGEIGGQRPDSAVPEVFQPADPARSMPRWLVLSAIGAIVLLVIGMTWMRDASLEEEEAPAETAAATTPQPAAPAPAAPTPQPPAAAAQGPVVLTATAPAWIQVTDGSQSLFQGELAPGQSYTVPATATAPKLKAGKPEALRITVGSAVAPPVGPAGRVASNVSLVATDLMRGGATPAPAGERATVPAPSAPPGVQNTVG